MPKKKYSVQIVWGSYDSACAGDGDWGKMENKPSEYRFKTQEEMDAFLYGVEEANGWMDYHVLTEEDLDEYKEAKK